MEKFALLNLLKAIDGLKSLSNEGKEPATPTPPTAKTDTAAKQTAEIPNIMYEALMRHETVSNRLRNKR